MRRVSKGALRAVPTIYPKSLLRIAGTRSLSSGAHSRDPLALPTLRFVRHHYRDQFSGPGVARIGATRWLAQQ
jgi:hypothetical protein